MPDVHYKHPRLVELYDVGSGWSPDRDFYLALAGKKRLSILDLGCGTGLIADAYAARGHDVTGVDPGSAMLDVARRKPNGAKIEWLCAGAETYRSAKRLRGGPPKSLEIRGFRICCRCPVIMRRTQVESGTCNR